MVLDLGQVAVRSKLRLSHLMVRWGVALMRWVRRDKLNWLVALALVRLLLLVMVMVLVTGDDALVWRWLTG